MSQSENVNHVDLIWRAARLKIEAFVLKTDDTGVESVEDGWANVVHDEVSVALAMVAS